MSLFKARDWWGTIVGEQEEFDTGCLCLANIDNSSSGAGEWIYVNLDPAVITNCGKRYF